MLRPFIWAIKTGNRILVPEKITVDKKHPAHKYVIMANNYKEN